MNNVHTLHFLHCANDYRVLLVVSKNVYNTQNCYIHGIRKDE